MRRIKERKAQKSKIKFYLKLSLLVILFSLVYMVVSTFSGSWNSTDKFTYITNDEDGYVKVIVVDPKLNEVTTLKIPNDTEVEVSRGYGILKIGNVWQLGINEKIGGDLLTETVTKNFYFPVTSWWNGKETNIELINRLKLSMFMKKIDATSRTEIDLAKSQFLKKLKLADGSSGYGLMGNISSRLTVYFSDYKLEGKNIKISIIDATGKYGIAEKVGAIAEVLGGKVFLIERNQVDNELDCNVSGSNIDATNNMVKYFKCTKVSDDSKFDLEVKIGNKFSRRF